MNLPVNSSQSAPCVSVIVPMFNVSQYIDQCIRSILAQTFEAFEIICVDDGCTDDTVDKVLAYSDPRIRLVRQANRGLAAARNTGINASRAPFIALLDSDDFWLPAKLEKHFDHLCSNPAVGVSYCASRFVDEAGVDMGIGQTPRLEGITRSHIICRNPVGNGSAPVIRRLALEQVAFWQDINGERRRAYFDERLRQSEDIELWTRMSLQTRWQFAGIGEALTCYRVNASGLSANLQKQLSAWQFAMALNKPGHELFFAQTYSLAMAYQKRYLARRAVQSANPLVATRYFFGALAGNARIMLEEPARTLGTGACVLMALLTGRFYPAVQAGFIKAWSNTHRLRGKQVFSEG